MSAKESRRKYFTRTIYWCFKTNLSKLLPITVAVINIKTQNYEVSTAEWRLFGGRVFWLVGNGIKCKQNLIFCDGDDDAKINVFLFADIILLMTNLCFQLMIQMMVLECVAGFSQLYHGQWSLLLYPSHSVFVSR